MVSHQAGGQAAGARAALSFIRAAFSRPRYVRLQVHAMDSGSHVARLGWGDPVLAPFYDNLVLLRRFFGNHDCWDLTVSM